MQPASLQVQEVENFELIIPGRTPIANSSYSTAPSFSTGAAPILLQRDRHRHGPLFPMEIIEEEESEGRRGRHLQTSYYLSAFGRGETMSANMAMAIDLSGRIHPQRFCAAGADLQEGQRAWFEAIGDAIRAEEGGEHGEERQGLVSAERCTRMIGFPRKITLGASFESASNVRNIIMETDASAYFLPCFLHIVGDAKG
ncbi:unnamed protein product [Cyclocybe aegerita]|uniref:Uncharacterized protein n=1 Tax=Cyclocybe aegerita TaxID=1973307 RepID=A0A8S0W5C8_CYCAE|nr:unnamed protein product [Cyclocybe aegerita]